MICPKCESSHIVKNGITRSKKQNYRCNACQCQFVENPEHYQISQEKKELIDRLLLEKISLAGIARSVLVSKKWLQMYVNKKLDHVPRKVNVSSKKKGQLVLECDEMWSFCEV